MKALFLPIFFQDKLHTQRWLRLPKVYLLYHEFKNINRYWLRKLQFSFLFSNLTFIPIFSKTPTRRQKAASSVILLTIFLLILSILSFGIDRLNII